MKNIAIFGSGKGSNALRIIEFFKEDSSPVHVALLVSNKAEAGFHRIAEDHQIPLISVNKATLESVEFIKSLERHNIDWIVLAGFLLKIPACLVQVYPGKIVNIHPALLPDFGGKGMYGKHVHESVLASDKKESGITIHYVNEAYDEGAIIFQKKLKIADDETSDSLQEKIHALEHAFYPVILKQLLTNG